MNLLKNSNGEFEFYGYRQSHPLDFPFLKAGDGVAAILKNLEELYQLQAFYSESEFSKLELYAINQLVVEDSGHRVSPLEQLDPNKHGIVAIFSELEDNVERALRTKSLNSGRFFAIADMFRKSSPSGTEKVVPFRGTEFDVLESVEIPAYFTNWAYINFLESVLQERDHLDILDMFSGSGAIGMSIAREMPSACVDCLDANYHAVRSMRRTIERSSIENVTAKLSECFGSIRANEKKYDLIVGNPPHMNMPVDYVRQINGRDPNFDIHRQFFRQASDFLEKDGRIMLIENAHSNVFEDFYSSLPRSLKLERHRLPDGFWEIAVVSLAI